MTKRETKKKNLVEAFSISMDNVRMVLWLCLEESKKGSFITLTCGHELYNPHFTGITEGVILLPQRFNFLQIFSRQFQIMYGLYIELFVTILIREHFCIQIPYTQIIHFLVHIHRLFLSHQHGIRAGLFLLFSINSLILPNSNNLTMTTYKESRDCSLD